jgi:predicted transposase/invertase (TIGR01784 family)
MITKRLNPLNDFLFLKVMGEKGSEEQLLAFLNAVLGRTGKNKLVAVEILEDRTFTPDILGDKASILDVRAKTENGTRVNIEVQLQNGGDMDRRSLFYWSREYTKHIKAGDKYIDLPNIIAINIVNFEFISSKNFHACFHLWEDTEKELLLTDALEIHFIDMVKFRRLRHNMVRGGSSFLDDSLHRWMTYFDKTAPEELLEEVLKMDVAIQKAQEKAAFVTQDEDALRIYEIREKAIMDWNSAVGYHTRETSKQIARKLKALNVPTEHIVESTGLTEKQINDL